MFDQLWEIFRNDFFILTSACAAWLQGGDPYGRLSARFQPGAFAYPPTFLTWAAALVPLGSAGYFVWTLLNLAGLVWLMKRAGRSPWPLLIWSPLFLHFWLGQCTLSAVLILWAAHQERAQRETGGVWRSALWGMALALALTKPQTALLPLAALLWDERRAPRRSALWAGLIGGTLLLALPPTLRDPGIWRDWIGGLKHYRSSQVQLAAWQGPSVMVWLLAAWLWHKSGRGGWRWWLTATAFPQTSFYCLVALLPAMDFRRNRWHLAGLFLAALVQGATDLTPMSWMLAIHSLAAWMIVGGPQRAQSDETQQVRAPVLPGARSGLASE